MAVFFLVKQNLILRRRLKDNPIGSAIFKPVFSPASIMTLALAANAMAFMQMIHTDFIIEANMEIFDLDGSIMRPNVNNWMLLGKQLSLLFGTGSLMALINGAVDSEYFEMGETPMLAGLRIQAEMFKRLMMRFWWLILGTGAVFGMAGGLGPMLFLAIELTVMWAGSLLVIWIAKTRENK